MMTPVKCGDCKYATLVALPVRRFGYRCLIDNLIHKGLVYCALGEKDYVEEDDLDSEIIKAEYHYEEGLGK